MDASDIGVLTLVMLAGFVAGASVMLIGILRLMDTDPVIPHIDRLLPRIDALVMLLEQREKRASRKARTQGTPLGETGFNPDNHAGPIPGLAESGLFQAEPADEADDEAPYVTPPPLPKDDDMA